MAQDNLPITALAKAIANSVRWINPLLELQDALIPFVSEESNIDSLVTQRAALEQKVALLDQTLATKETHLVNLDQRITLAEDERKLRVDADLADYQKTIDSQRRQLAASIDQLASRLADLEVTLKNKGEHLTSLALEIAAREQAITQLKSNAANLLGHVQAVVEGSPRA